MKNTRRINVRRNSAGGKVSKMETSQQATPPANNGGLTKEDVSKMISDAIAPLSQSTSKITESITALTELIKKPGTEERPKAETPAGLTEEQVKKLIADATTTAQQDMSQKAARDAYIGEKLKDLPAAYRNQLGTDKSKWAAEEQALRDQFKADLEAAGVKKADLGNAAKEGGNASGSQVVDRTKIDPIDLMQMKD